MNNIGASEILVVAAAVMSYANLHLAIVTLALGVLGAVVRYSIAHNEKQEKAKEIEGVAENFTNLLSGLTSGIGPKDKSNLH